MAQSINSTNRYISIRIQAESLVAGLASPEKPTVCPVCIVSLLTDAQNDDHSILRLCAEFHPIFDAFLLALCTWPARYTRQELRQLLERNSRDCTLVDHRSFRVFDYPAVFYNAAASLINTALLTRPHAPAQRAYIMTKRLRDRAGRWPARLEQLFPLGERETVDALLDFAETCGCVAPASALRSLLAVARPAVWPVLLSGRRLFTLVTRMLDSPPDVPWMRRNGAALSAALDLLGAVRSGPDAHPRDVARLLSAPGDAELLFIALTAAVRQLPATGHAPLLCELVAWCTDIYARIPAPRPRPLPVRRIIHNQPPGAPTSSTAVDLIAILQCMAHSRSCWTCGLSPLRTARGGKAFPACAGCRLARYCGTACQRRHWADTQRSEGAPHKAVCPLLRRIKVEHVVTPERVHQTLYTAKFDAEETRTLKAWINAVKCGP